MIPSPLGRCLGELAEPGAEQARIGGPRPLQRFDFDDQGDQGIAVAHGLPIAQLGSLNPQSFSLAIDAFSRGALRVDDFVEGRVALEGHTYLGAFFTVEVFDTAVAFGELLMLTALAHRFGKSK